MGMTRAMKKLFLFGARERTIYGESRFQGQSRFIDEIHPQYLEIITPESGIRNTDPRRKFEHIVSEINIEEPRIVYDEFTDDDPWKIGMKIRHPSFGAGIIKAKEGMGADAKLTVIFPGTGQKKLIARYVSMLEA